MKGKKLVLPLLLSAAFVSFAPLPASAAAQDLGDNHQVSQQEAGRTYMCDGLQLVIPAKYDQQLLTIADAKDGKLFRVSEKASIEAAKALGRQSDGAGWLFSIGRVSTAQLHKLLCLDMSGVKIFAADGNGNHYVFYHPTDVRYERQDAKAMQRDGEIWEELTRWAGEDVRPSFRQVNGLSEETYDNSVVGIALARVMYAPDVRYTLSTTQYGPLNQPNGFDPAPYLERLISGANYTVVDNSETPNGEYVVLRFPEENLRYDFFRLNGKENYVREVRDDGTETLYLGHFADNVQASNVMQELYDIFARSRNEELPGAE